MKRSGQNPLAGHINALEIIHSLSSSSLASPQFKHSIFGKYNIFMEILRFQPPIDRAKVDNFINHIQDELQQYNFSVELTQSLWRKLYSQIVVGCILEKNQTDGEVFINKLLHLIKSRKDIQEVIYYLFRVTSLIALSDYSLESNREYKYSQPTKALFFFLLAQVKTNKRQYLYQLCDQIVARESSKDEKNKGVLGCIGEAIKAKTRDVFLERVIKILIAKEKQMIGPPLRKQAEQLKTIIYTFILNNWGIQIKSDEDFKKLQGGDQDLIRILKILSANPRPIYLSAIISTNLIKKMKAQGKVSPVTTSLFDPNRYKKLLQHKGAGDIQKFRRCKEGSYLRKCNFKNKEVRQKFMKIGEDGVYWGTNQKLCKLKYRWQQIMCTLYGNKTANFNSNFKYVRGDMCFSLCLKNRTLDFVCNSREEVFAWVQGISFIMNRLQKEAGKQYQSIEQRKMVQSRGLLLWSELLMKVQLRGEPWELKGRGLARFAKQKKII